MNGFLKNAIGMLAAGVLASGLVLAAWALSPKPEPLAEQPHEHGAGEELRPEQLLGRWSFVDAKNQKAFVEFTEFGSWFGSDGCNGTSGVWFEQHGALQMHPTGAMTQIGCDNAPVPSGEISGSSNAEGELELLVAGSDEENGTVALRRSGDGLFALTGTDWALEDSTDPAIANGAQPMITFSPDGQWGGTDGCNGMNGTWSLEPETNGSDADSAGAVLQIGPGYATTLKACEHSSPFPAELKQPHKLTVFSEDAILLQDLAAGDTEPGIFLRRVALDAQE